MSYLVDFQPLALKAMRLEALLPSRDLTPIKDKVHIDRDTVCLLYFTHASAQGRRKKFSSGG